MSTRKSPLPDIAPRAVVRTAFLAFFIYLSVRLWLFAMWALGRSVMHVARPDAVAGIIPVGAYTSLFAWLKTGVFDAVVPAGVVIVLGALLLSVVFKRGFCGWICPVGTVFEAAGSVGRFIRRRIPAAPKWLGRNLPVSRRIDKVFRALRYGITVMLLLFVGLVPASAALDFQKLPYYAGSDVKILSYFVNPPAWYLGLILLAVGACLSFGNVWCRYLCPLGGLYGAVGSASACTIVRDEELCTSCTKCARACHAGIRVDKVVSVRSPECDGCMDCVIACPKQDALTARAFGRFVMPWWAWPAAVVGLWLLVYVVALGTGHWHSTMPEEWFVQSIRTLGI